MARYATAVLHLGPFQKGKRFRAAESNFTLTGQSQFLTAPILAKPLQFNNLSLDDPDTDFPSNLNLARSGTRGSEADDRIMEMMAARAAQQDGIDEDEDAIVESKTLDESAKKDRLQRILHMAASNGDSERVEKIVKGKAREYVDLDKGDEEGTVPLIYAACFVRGYLGADALQRLDRLTV